MDVLTLSMFLRPILTLTGKTGDISTQSETTEEKQRKIEGTGTEAIWGIRKLFSIFSPLLPD